jgi:hypothetical protein
MVDAAWLWEFGFIIIFQIGPFCFARRRRASGWRLLLLLGDLD